jgi:hypothetical protein
MSSGGGMASAIVSIAPHLTQFDSLPRLVRVLIIYYRMERYAQSAHSAVNPGICDQ